nr:hypothetical protein HK105_005475 [Polyrhizophydium stewartii]
MTTAREVRKMGEAELRRTAAGLGLDSLGPPSALVDRIIRHIRLAGAASATAGTQQDHSAAAAAQDHNDDSEAGGDAHGTARTADAVAGAAAGRANGSVAKVAPADGDKKKKRRKKKRTAARVAAALAANSNGDGNGADADADADGEIEATIDYVPETLADEIQDPAFEAYAEIFAKFAPPAPEEGGEDQAKEGSDPDDMDLDNSDKDSQDEADGDVQKDGKPLSKKKRRLATRLSVAELKQLVRKPEVVEWVDVSSADPKLLVHLKSYRNTVPVPMHWSLKRKYLQNKRGTEKPPFQLPDFIRQTGISEMRDAVKEKEDAAKLKTKTRERVQPKMGKIEIDYQKLHDAFFRWQTKPRMTIFGELYFEGKEHEPIAKNFRPGVLSEELRIALNMPPLAPPPWLISMQRHGPPPSYPQLKIPGLNAPIPAGAQWGFHPGGWGKPPVDEFNRPLYGDVFGVYAENKAKENLAEQIDRTRWGELESEPEEEEVEEEDEQDEDDDGQDDEKEVAAAGATGAPIADGLTTPSVAGGLETPDFIELRKRPAGEAAAAARPLYTVIDQKSSAIRGFMGSQHVYDMSAASSGGGGGAVGSAGSESAAAKAAAAKRKLGIVSSGVDVALNPEDLAAGLDGGAIQRRFDEQVSAVRAETAGVREDMSDMVAEHAQRQAKKRQKRDESDKRDKFKF